MVLGTIVVGTLITTLGHTEAVFVSKQATCLSYTDLLLVGFYWLVVDSGALADAVSVALQQLWAVRGAAWLQLFDASVRAKKHIIWTSSYRHYSSF